MPASAAPELFWLTATVLLTGVLWIPYIVNRVRELGPPGWTWYPLPDPPPQAGWAKRAIQAHVNATENLVLFAPLALTVHLVGASAVAIAACRIYFFARLGHALGTDFGLPIPFRTVAFLTGYACNITLAVVIFRAVSG